MSVRIVVIRIRKKIKAVYVFIDIYPDITSPPQLDLFNLSYRIRSHILPLLFYDLYDEHNLHETTNGPRIPVEKQ